MLQISIESIENLHSKLPFLGGLLLNLFLLVLQSTLKEELDRLQARVEDLQSQVVTSPEQLEQVNPYNNN